MSTINSGSHLTLSERQIILTGIRNGSTKSAIAETIGKDKSTVGKEIRLHRYCSSHCSLTRECGIYKKCKPNGPCPIDCQDFVQFVCSRRDRTPGACDGCSDFRHCHFNKYLYDPVQANLTYTETLRDSRAGVDLNSKDAEALARIIKPLMDQGQAPYQIIKDHPELGICEKTLYNYIDEDIFGCLPLDIRIKNVDLRRKVSRRITKKESAKYKKRESHKYLQGRLYVDYQAYVVENPDAFVTQMDTVYNDITEGPFIQTFKFIKTGLLVGVYHDTKTAEDMVNGVESLYTALGTEVFAKYCAILLTDRGSEFSDPDHMEMSNDGLQRTHVFFCNPLSAGQKGSLENKHRELRYILPKDTDLRDLGLVDQDSLNTAISHVDSAPVKFLGGKSPLELTQFLYPDLYERIIAFGLRPIDRDDVILKPYLLKKDQNKVK